MPDGWLVRAMSWTPERGAHRGTLLFIGGRADFIEKYGEAYRHFLDWGFEVVAFDWRGQGGSGRLGTGGRGHCESFEPWVDDLDAIVGRLAGAGPLMAVGHSMGGHLLLRHLTRRRSPVARAALLAPMLGIRPVPAPFFGVARTAARLGRGGDHAWGQRPYGAHQRSPSRQALLTGCATRFADEHRRLAADPDLSLGGVTWGWLAAASASLRTLLAPGVLEGIDTPTLTLVGTHERLVVSVPARRLRHGDFHQVAGGRHELLRDADAPREETFTRLRAFLAP